MLIGITGTDGSGKGTVVQYLTKEKGCTHFSARSIWIKELEKRQKEITRANMRLVANELREKYGNDFLISYYSEIIKKKKISRAVIESIRTIAEVHTLKASGGILIAIDADKHIRFARITERNSETDSILFDEFIIQETLEADDPNPHGMQKRRVMEMADYTILNNGTREELYIQIESAYDAIIKHIKM